MTDDQLYMMASDDALAGRKPKYTSSQAYMESYRFYKEFSEEFPSEDVEGQLFRIDCPWCGTYMGMSEHSSGVNVMCESCKVKFDKAVAESKGQYEEAMRKYAADPRCRHCGEKAGFSMGTGDCGCEEEYEPGGWAGI